MINLIPTKDKKLMLRDFYIRFLVVLFFAFSFSIFAACAAMIPAFVVSLEKKNAIDLKIKTQDGEVMPEIDQKALSVINALNSKMDIIEKAKKNKYLVSENIIEKILSKKISGIQITQIAYKRDTLGTKMINVNGVALNREQLLAFRRSFENDAVFSKVVLPISNFVKGSDINFSLNLTPA